MGDGPRSITLTTTTTTTKRYGPSQQRRPRHLGVRPERLLASRRAHGRATRHRRRRGGTGVPSALRHCEFSSEYRDGCYCTGTEDSNDAPKTNVSSLFVNINICREMVLEVCDVCCVFSVAALAATFHINRSLTNPAPRVPFTFRLYLVVGGHRRELQVS